MDKCAFMAAFVVVGLVTFLASVAILQRQFIVDLKRQHENERCKLEMCRVATFCDSADLQNTHHYWSPALENVMWLRKGLTDLRKDLRALGETMGDQMHPACSEEHAHIGGDGLPIPAAN